MGSDCDIPQDMGRDYSCNMKSLYLVPVLQTQVSHMEISLHRYSLTAFAHFSVRDFSYG